MIGIEERDTESGIHVFRVHYEADPAKRSTEWQAEAARGMLGGKHGSAWRREMEIDWTVASGLPVYGELFVRDVHIAKEPLLAYRELPIYRGWDFGLTPACVWVQRDPMGRLNVLAESVTWDGRGAMRQQGIEQFCPVVTLISNEDYGGARWIDYADPAGWQRAQTDEKTCVEIMHAHGMHPRPGPVTWTARKRAMTDILSKMVGGRAALQFSPDCAMLIEGLAGAYRYEEIGETGRYKETVEKNAWSHVMNGLEYVIGGLFGTQQKDDDWKPRRMGKPDAVTGY